MNINKASRSLDPRQTVLIFHLSVKKLFEEGWLHPDKPLPTIRYIFKLLKTQDEMGEHHAYELVSHIPPFARASGRTRAHSSARP